MIEEVRTLAQVCTLQIGGPARYWAEVHTEEEAREALRFARNKNLSVHILGKGSNTLFDDRGFDGLVICNRILGFSLEGTRVRAGAGYSFSRLGFQTARAGLAGLEFAAGIPGSVGGALAMNAGASGQQVADTLVEVEWLSPDGELQKLSRSSIQMSYRFSSLRGAGGIILGATFELQEDATAATRQQTFVQKKTSTQPYHLPSAGCMFRNPPGESAGRWIAEAGLGGLRVGDAEVSTLHANFIVNQGKATAEEVRTLVHKVQEAIHARHGVWLETEVCWIDYSAL